MSNLNILTGGFFVLALYCRVDVVRAVFTPANVGDLKYAIGSCNFLKCTCSGGCLGENATGSCPTFAASDDATGNPRGMMGDWDVSNVTSLRNSKSSPPVFFCLICGPSDPCSLTPFLFLSFFLVGVTVSVQRCLCVQCRYFKMEHCQGDGYGVGYVHSTSCSLFLPIESFSHSPPSLFCFFLIFFFGWVNQTALASSSAFNHAHAFNADISKWNTAKVTRMYSSRFTLSLSLSFLVSSQSDPVLSHLLFFFTFNFCGLTTAYDILLQRFLVRMHSTRIFQNGALLRCRP